MALEETWVRLRQGEPRQPVLRLKNKNKVMVSSQNLFCMWSVWEMTMISIPGDANKSSLSEAAFLNLWSIGSSGEPVTSADTQAPTQA